MDRTPFAFAVPPPPDELAAFPLNDLGNAMRLVRMAGGVIGGDGTVNCDSAELLFLRGVGWVGWNRRHWDFEHGPLLAERLSHKVAEGLPAQASVMADRTNNGREVHEHIRKSGDAGRLSAMLRVAETYLQVASTDFDCDPLSLNVGNGTLRFRREPGDGFSVERTSHDLRDRISRIANAEYDQAATCPLWERSLKEWLPDTSTRNYVQRLMGYVLTGLTSEQVFVILQGRGRDGKSTFVSVLRNIMGGYADVADVHTFLDSGGRSGGDASPDLARLSGDLRLVSVAEPPLGAKLAEAKIKSFTGGAPILARRLYRDSFSYLPKAKVLMECNTRPRVKGDDDGIWRRIRLIRFTRQVPPNDVDRDLGARLMLEASGILNWLLDGVSEYLSQGLHEPPEITDAVDEYRRSSSIFAEWFEERVLLDPSAEVLTSDLYGSYEDYCSDNEGARPMSKRAFGDALTERGVMKKAGKDGNGRIRRLGARLRT